MRPRPARAAAGHWRRAVLQPCALAATLQLALLLVVLPQGKCPGAVASWRTLRQRLSGPHSVARRAVGTASLAVTPERGGVWAQGDALCEAGPLCAV